MKVPYSYRQHFFAPVLIVSVLGHAGIFATGAGLFSLSPKYGLEQAPSSMEVVILKAEPTRQKTFSSRVLTAMSPSETKVPNKRIEKLKEKKIKASKPVYVPPQQGAVRHEPNPYLKNPAPIYPQRARENGWEGLVMLSVHVQSDGKPGEVNVEKSSGYKILDDAAVNAVKKWLFKPAALGNVSFSTWVRIPVRFSLAEDRKA